MRVDATILRDAERRGTSALTRWDGRAALDGGQGGELRVLGTVGPVPPDQLAGRRDSLHHSGFVPNATEFERILGTNDLVDEPWLERALAAARPVCRLSIRTPAGRERGWATGFLVSPRLILTNWHVFRTADEAENGLAEFEYKRDFDGNLVPPIPFLLAPGRFYAASRDLDYALVAAEPRSIDGRVPLASFGWHTLLAEPDKVLRGEFVTLIQHPGGEPRQFALRENQVIDRDDPAFLWYTSDTAPGSSGAPAFNDSFQVVALHHAGKPLRDGARYVLRDGRRVDSLDGIDEDAVAWEANEGIRTSKLHAHLSRTLDARDDHAAELLSILEEEHPMPTIRVSQPASTHPTPQTNEGGAIVIPIELRLSVNLGGAAATPVSPPARVRAEPQPEEGVPGVERAVLPPIDRDYSNRTGYDPLFLGVHVPLPIVTDNSLASLLDGSPIIPYEHFSIALHRGRRLALFTASNVDGNPAARRPEAGSYSRDALGNKGKNDTEAWLVDARLPAQHQLPDKFYSADGGAFDRGHIVRREDMCWGSTRAQVVKANADTFHCTNCSPQMAGFNQSLHGGLWGELENEILAQVEGGGSRKYSLFAGPVLADDDPLFDGRDAVGAVRIQIPRRFWKVVITQDDVSAGLQAFAFLLEQDLTEVPLEAGFRLDADWRPYLVSIAHLESLLAGFRFPDEVRDADQFGAQPAVALAKRISLPTKDEPATLGSRVTPAAFFAAAPPSERRIEYVVTEATGYATASSNRAKADLLSLGVDPGFGASLVHSAHEDGEKLMRLSDAEVNALRASRPGLVVEPNIAYRTFRHPWLSDLGGLLLPASGPTRTVTVRVRGAAAFGKATVYYVTGNGAIQGETDANGACALTVPAVGQPLQLAVVPQYGCWGRVVQSPGVGPSYTVDLQPLPVNDWGRRLLDAAGVGRAALGKGVKIGLLDTGVAPHRDLRPSAAGRNMVLNEPTLTYADDTEGHGTHCAGVIAGRNPAIQGFAPEAELVAYRVFPADGGGASTYDLARAIRQAVADGCDILSMSLGASTRQSAIGSAVEAAYEKGVLVVAATGNEAGPVSWPAAFPTVLAVSAFGDRSAYLAGTPHASADPGRVSARQSSSYSERFIASFSNSGPEVGVAAPGVAILSTVPWADGYAAWDGTSMACPQVTGLAALVLSNAPAIRDAVRDASRVDALKTALQRFAQAFGTRIDLEGQGWIPLLQDPPTASPGAARSPPARSPTGE